MSIVPCAPIDCTEKEGLEEAGCGAECCDQDAGCCCWCLGVVGAEGGDGVECAGEGGDT